MKREEIKNQIEKNAKLGFEKGKEKLQQNKKRIKRFVIGTLTGAIVLGSVGVGTMYAYMTSNINYTQEQLANIALSQIDGEIVGVEREINEDTLSLVYEFHIKDENHILREIELDTKTGAIVVDEDMYDLYKFLSIKHNEAPESNENDVNSNN